MINGLLKRSVVIVAVGLLFSPYGWAMPGDDDLSVLSKLGFFAPAPLEPNLSRDGMTLYNAGLPVVYVANPQPSREPVRVPPPIDLLTAPESATSIFSITYAPNGSTDPWGETCYAFPSQAQTSFSAAANVWANIIQSSVPIRTRACWADLGSSSILGYSGGGALYRDFSGAPRANTWYTKSLANALTGTDLGPANFDMHITYNLNFSWYYGTDGNTPAGQYDLMSVVLHEIAHGLNFSGSMSYSAGSGSWGYGTGYPNIYDTLMRDGSGNQLINTGVYPNPSGALGSTLTSNNIWFHGSNAMTANGGARVKIYAPSTWSGGSSYSHLDYTTFNDTLNELMVYAFSSGESVHDPGPVTKGLLMDLGWQNAWVLLPDLIETNVSNPPATATAGDSFSVTDTVKNQGSASAGGSITSYYLSFDAIKGSSGDILLAGSRSVPSLEVNAGESSSLMVTIPSDTAAGSYYLLACADNTNVIVESNEGNNCIASASQVNVSAVNSVDPSYSWHTFYGRSGYDTGRSITADGSGNIYITGDSSATWSGPAGQAPLHAHSGGYDIFVLKLDSSGSYQWHTFYGSGTWDLGYGIATDGGGNIYITGESDAIWNGPAGQAPLHAHSGNMDIVILKLNSSGAYQWHTYYGSSSREDPRSIVTDGSGNVYVAGYGEATWSGPAGQSPLRTFGGVHTDFFVLKLNRRGTYQWHIFSGATNCDNAA
ncbi:MAG: SBBP repeat-containing protein, partial [Euryarchaeota archaeon]|nr:SBBP repeat-containing protein [Euryarchaeota archaeon]